MTQTKESNNDRSQNNNHKDHEGEVEMLRVVACIDGSQAAPAVPLPEGCAESVDEATNTPYYHHSEQPKERSEGVLQSSRAAEVLVPLPRGRVTVVSGELIA